jgi:hypothetical protein
MVIAKNVKNASYLLVNFYVFLDFLLGFGLGPYRVIAVKDRF